MASYVLFQSSKKESSITVVMYATIPDEDNSVSVNKRLVVQAWVFDTTSRVEATFLEVVLPGTQVKLDSGEWYEWEEIYHDVDVDGNVLPPAGRVTRLEAWVSDRETAKLIRLNRNLDFFGKTGVSS